MSSWLSKLRRQPKVVKDRYAFLGASVITGVIAAVWLISLPSQLQVPIANEQAADFVETKGAFSQFFSNAKNQLGGVMSALKNSSSTQEAASESLSETGTSSNIVIPTLTASTTRQFQTSPVIIETAPTTSLRRAETILIGTSSESD